MNTLVWYSFKQSHPQHKLKMWEFSRALDAMKAFIDSLYAPTPDLIKQPIADWNRGECKQGSHLVTQGLKILPIQNLIDGPDVVIELQK